MTSFSRRLMLAGMLVVLVASALRLFDWNALRAPIAHQISGRLDRDFAIKGDLSVDLSSTPSIVANDVVLSNASWGEDAPMLRVQRAAVRIDLGQLLRGRPFISEIALVKPDLLLQRSDQGRGNWRFGAEENSAGGIPRIGSLVIDDGTLRYRDPLHGLDVMLRLTSGEAASSRALVLRIAGDGSLHGEPFAVEGRAGSLLSRASAEQPYWLDVQARGGASSVAFSGTLSLFGFERIAGKLELRGADLSKLYPLIPVPLPRTRPYRLSGLLERQGDLWSLVRLSGTIGDSDLSGSVGLDSSGRRPSIEANLVSRRLNYRDLGGLIGLPPGGESRTASTSQQEKVAARRAGGANLLPHKPYKLERLRAIDADVNFHGEQVAASAIPLRDVVAHLKLQDGELKLDPLELGIAGGRISGNLTANARDPVLHTAAQISAHNVDIARIWPEFKPPKGHSGRVGGRAALVATGNSMGEILGSMNGDLALIMTGGSTSALSLMLANLDLARASALLLGGDESASIRCAVADFKASDGVLTTTTLIVDTTAAKITGAGNINFRDERFDLRLDADSKRASPLALRGPVLVQGSLKKPDVRPELGQAAVRAAGAVALGALATPLAALLPLIDTGDAENVDCKALVAARGSDKAG